MSKTDNIRKFAAAAAAGHVVVAGPETAAELNEAFASVGMPYRLEPFDLLEEGCVYALCQPDLAKYVSGGDPSVEERTRKARRD